MDIVKCVQVAKERGETDANSIGLRIKRARERQHPEVYQEDAARIAGVTRPMISYYETGKFQPPLRVLRKLAKEWNAPELLDDITDIEPLPQEGMLPDLGELSAGRFQLSEADVSYSPVPVEYMDEENRVGTIRGDSMSPTLQPRDRVIVRLTNSPPVGSIVVAMADDGEVVVKRLVYRSGERVLIGDNPDHPPTDPKRCQLVGEVIALIGRTLH